MSVPSYEHKKGEGVEGEGRGTEARESAKLLLNY